MSIIRHPSETFLKFLMTQVTNPHVNDDGWVSHAVVSLGFPQPQIEYLRWLRSELYSRVPAGFQPQNRYHRDSVKFLREQGIWGLHNPDKNSREATLLVTNLRARPLVENLLLGRVEPKDIAKKVNARLSEHLTTEGIEAYRHYYWQVSLLKVEDWSQLLEEYEYQRSQTLSILQVGPGMALHKTGFQQQIESKVMLREMMETIFFDFREWKMQPRSPAKTKALVTLSLAATKIDERMHEADAALKDSLQAFEKFRMQTDSQGVADVRQVAPAGNYTGSGAKLLEAPRDDKEAP